MLNYPVHFPFKGVFNFVIYKIQVRCLLKSHASLILRQKADEANQKLRRYKKYLKGTGGGGGVAIPPGNKKNNHP
jgi:hypothetical protein